MNFGPGQLVSLLGGRAPCPAAQFGSKCEVPHKAHGCLMGRVSNEDPQVSGVGFVCAVAFLIANQETLLWRQDSHHTIKAASDLTGRVRTCWKEDPHSSE